MDYTLQEFKRSFQDNGAIPLLISSADIALVGYCCSACQCLLLFGELLDNLGVPLSKVKDIIIHGKNKVKLKNRNKELEQMFQQANVIYTGISGNSRFSFEPVHRMLCVHFLDGVNDRNPEPLQYAYSTIGKLRFMNQIIVTRNISDDMFGVLFDIQTCCNLLSGPEYEAQTEIELTTYCSERRETLQRLIDNSLYEAAFEQCQNEMTNGCEECPLAVKYDSRHICPYFQLQLSEFFRNGWFVPQSECIAHSLVRQAAKQGFVPAMRALADEYLNGRGCSLNVELADSILSNLADGGDAESALKLTSLYTDKDLLYRNVPWIARLARSGNYEMQDMMIDMYFSGNNGVYANGVLEQEWISFAANSDNPRCVRIMAEQCESNENWKEAYTWYKKLAEISPDSVSDGKLEEIELKVLTNGSTDIEIAKKGMDYLFGYHRVERDINMAFRCLSYAKNKEISLATGLLGQMYFYGIGVQPDVITGMELICDAVRDDDMLSLEKFIFVLHADEVEDENWTDGIRESIDKEIAKDNSFAYYLKGKCCLNGRLYGQSDADVFELFRKSAMKGYAPAQYQLAMMYLNGIGTSADSDRYHCWLHISAINGSFEAAGKYGEMLFNDEQKRNDAFNFLKTAYDQGYDDGGTLWCLARCYFEGIGTDKDLAAAYSLCRKVAEAGNANARVRLCQDLFRGNASLPKNYVECARWGEAALTQGKKQIRFETAYSLAETGNRERAYELYMELAAEGNAAAMNNLGCLEAEDEKAFEWFKKAADRGDCVAQKNVARYYRYGIATDKDEQMAFDYYQKSANHGYQDSIIEMASLYRYGYCTEKNTDEAVRWYKKAITMGHDDSMFELASLYLTDLADVQEAICWYKRAAEKGSENAMLQLGEIFECGNAVEPDTGKAIFWYRKAVAKGNDDAKSRLVRLGANWIVDGKIESGIMD